MDDDLFGFIEAPSQEPGDTDDWDVAESDSGSGFDSDDSGSRQRKRRGRAKKKKQPPLRAKQALPDLSPMAEDSKAGDSSGEKANGSKRADEKDASDGELEIVASLPPLPKRRKQSTDELPLLWASPPSIGGAGGAAGTSTAGGSTGAGGGRGGRGRGGKGRGRGRGRGRKGASASPAPDTAGDVVVVDSCQDVLAQSRQLSAMLDAALHEQQASQGRGESPEPLQPRGSGRRHFVLKLDPSLDLTAGAVDLTAGTGAGANGGGTSTALVPAAAAAAVADPAAAGAPADGGAAGVAAAADAGPRVLLRFRLGGDKQELRLNVPCGAPLRQAMDRFAAAAADRQWAPAGAPLWFEFDGDALAGGETAGDLGMEDDDIVDVGVKK